MLFSWDMQTYLNAGVRGASELKSELAGRCAAETEFADVYLGTTIHIWNSFQR